MRVLLIIRRMLDLYNEKRIPRAAAALSYYLTMTLFPLIICLYSLLGYNYTHAVRVLNFVEQFLSAETTQTLRSFLEYVSVSHNSTMLAAGLTVLVSSASAGVRTMQVTIGEIQGKQRFRTLSGFLFSLVFSLVFLAAMYFALVVMLTGPSFIELVNSYLPFVDIGNSWQWLRFLVMGGIMFAIFWGIYLVLCKRGERYPAYPGAIFATVAMVAMSLAFSSFIAVSARYPLVYGSLASLILMMFWLYLSCQIIFLGAAMNVALRDRQSGPRKGA